MVEYGGLIVSDALEAPAEEGDVLGEVLFQGAFRGQVVYDAVAEALPAGRGLYALDDDGVGGPDAVARGVAARPRFAGVCIGAAFGYGSPRDG